MNTRLNQEVDLKAAAITAPWQETYQMVLEQIEKLLDQYPQTQFISCWDFDGTLLKGDIGEGMHTNEDQGYYGLVEEAIIRGFIPQYPSKQSLKTFWHDYTTLAKKQSLIEAYQFLVECLYSMPKHKLEDFKKLCITLVDEQISNYFYPETLKLMKALNKKNLFPMIVSASPQILIDSVVHHFPVDPEFALGVNDPGIDKQAFNYAEGKVIRIKAAAESLSQRLKVPTCAIFAAGDSWDNDGAMLRMVCENGGLGVCINPSKIPKWVSQFNIYCTEF